MIELKIALHHPFPRKYMYTPTSVERKSCIIAK